MSRKRKKGLVPRLRFPEFRGSGEWKSNKLEEIATIYKGRGISKTDITVQGKTPCIRYGELYTYYSEIIETILSKTNLPKSQLFLSVKNDVIIPSSGETKLDIATASCVMIDDVALGGDLNIIRTGVNGPFLSYYLNGAKKHTISKVAQGDTVVHLYPNQLYQVDLYLPSESAEQQKIADCLSSLDDLISAQTKKVEALKVHKKSLMQQLFPVEGEMVPKLRFPEFRGAGEWVTQKLSNLLERVSIPVEIDPEAVYQEIGIRSHGKGIFHKEPVLGKTLGNKRVFWVEENAFIVNIVFAWELAVANTKETEKGMIASHRFPMYKPYDNKASVRYIKYFFLTQKGKELLWIASPGGAGRNKTLGQKEFEKLEFLVPVRIEEQQKIADCLSSLDNFITVQIRKLEALKAHKKGLMQQLFPSIDDHPAPSGHSSIGGELN